METRGASAFSHVSSRDDERDRRVQARIQFDNVQENLPQYRVGDFQEDGIVKKQIDPADKVEIISSHDEKPTTPLTSFDDACLPDFVKHAIRCLGFKEPTAVQKYSIPIAISGRDLIGIAKTGSGKTFSYMIPCLMRISEEKRQRQQLNRMMESRGRYSPAGLVLAPTRELAIQIHSAALSLAQRSGLKVCVVYGGANKGSQLGELSNGVDILIATPGRLIDFFRGGSLRLSNVSFFVLDEADRMLDMGFYPQVQFIAENINQVSQTMFFSATWPREVQQFSRELCKNKPVRLVIGDEGLALNNSITQTTEYVMESNKRKKLLDLLRAHDSVTSKFIVFVKTKKSCDRICKILENSGYRAVAIHGDKAQAQRDQIIRAFRSNHKNILVATDVASRGLDIRDINYVINFDFPQSIEDYIHRIGRTGRAGAVGSAFTFFNETNITFARDLLMLLQKANQSVPQELFELAQSGDPRRGDRDSGYGRSNRYGNKDYYYGNKYQNGNGYQSYNRSNGYGQGNSVTGHFNSRDQQTFLQKSFYSAWNPEQMKQYATELMFNMTANMQGYQNGGYNYNGSTAADNGDAHQGETRTGARLDPNAYVEPEEEDGNDEEMDDELSQHEDPQNGGDQTGQGYGHSSYHGHAQVPNSASTHQRAPEPDAGQTPAEHGAYPNKHLGEHDRNQNEESGMHSNKPGEEAKEGQDGQAGSWATKQYNSHTGYQKGYQENSQQVVASGWNAQRGAEVSPNKQIPEGMNSGDASHHEESTTAITGSHPTPKGKLEQSSLHETPQNDGQLTGMDNANPSERPASEGERSCDQNNQETDANAQTTAQSGNYYAQNQGFAGSNGYFDRQGYGQDQYNSYQNQYGNSSNKDWQGNSQGYQQQHQSSNYSGGYGGNNYQRGYYQGGDSTGRHQGSSDGAYQGSQGHHQAGRGQRGNQSYYSGNSNRGAYQQHQQSRGYGTSGNNGYYNSQSGYGDQQGGYAAQNNYWR